MPKYHNFYECPECNHCWDHEDDSQPMDDCTVCGETDVEPCNTFDNE